MTFASFGSPWAQLEVNAAIALVRQQRMRAVIPVVAEPVNPSDIPPLWLPFHRYDATQNSSDTLRRSCVCWACALGDPCDATVHKCRPSRKSVLRMGVVIHRRALPRVAHPAA